MIASTAGGANVAAPPPRPVLRPGAATYLPLGEPQWPLSVAADGPVEVVFEGWLHEPALLADALALPRETSPAKLVAAAYARWGLAMLRSLDGAFALYLNDLHEDVWYAARDRTGIVPLFYAQGGHGAVLATTAEAVRNHPQVRAGVDRLALAAHLLTAGRDVEASSFEGVARLLPGYALRGHGTAAPTAIPYWSPLPEAPPAWLREHDVERFPRLMRDVLTKQTANRQAGVFLSGGLDSGTVAALAVDALADRTPPLRAYGLAFDDPESNEEAVQRGLADALDLPLTLQRIDLARDPPAAFEASLALNDSWPHPLASTFRSLYVDLGRRAHDDGCDVVLTGDGGDEWLTIHMALAADLLRSLSLGELRALTDTVRTAQGLPTFRAGRRVLWEYGLRLLLLDAASSAARRVAPHRLHQRRRRLAGQSLPAWLAPDRTLREGLIQRLASVDQQGPRYHREVVHDTLRHPLTLLYLEEAFEVGRRTHAVQIRPFYHPDVVSFLAHLPPHLRSLGGRYKGMLRRLLHARFPHLGYDRQRKPYATNFTSTMVYEGLRRGGPATRSFPALADLGVVDGAATRAFVEDAVRHAPDRTAVPKRLWLLLCAERWVQSRSSA